MAHKALNQRKFSLLTSTALTGQAAALGALSVVFGASSAFALDPNALPQDPNVVGGAASFHQSGATLNVNQSTNRTVIDWRSFDIGSNATTNFVQPGASSIAVNRVNSSANPTQIQGSLNANGQVWILNPNGVLFGKTAKIDVAGIVASTGNINTNAFMRGDNRLNFTGSDGGEVSNAGLISVADGGLAAFVAPSVRNSGIIRARVGKVTLAAGTTFTLDLAGDQLVELGLGANNAIVDQSGQVLADGSVVNITAKAATKVVDSVINVSGTVLASSAYEDGGTIVLTADNITTTDSAALKADAGTNGDGGTIYGYADKLGKYDGTFSAQGGSQSGDGGFIETSGKKVQIADGISIDTRAANGKTGNWTIDPEDLVIGGDDAGVAVSTIVTAMNNSGLTLTADNSITVNEEINTSGQANSNTLALNDENTDNNLTINLNDKIILGASQHLTGQGTTVHVSSNGLIQNGVDVAATGGATVNVADGTYAENVTINKSGLTLISENGRDVTTITGQGSSAEGTVWVAPNANNFTLGGLGKGFTIVGIDNADSHVESAAVYFKGTNSGSTVQGNRITANGDAGLQGEYNAANVNLTIDNNIFDGKTFVGSAAGTGDQFEEPNVPRQLVVFGGGSGTTNTQNIIFTNNQVIGTAGGLDAALQEAGNSLVTIDAIGATITGNTFAGTTAKWADALRVRGSDTSISGNTFDGSNMTAGTNMLEANASTLSGSFADVLTNNTWNNGSAWVDHAVGGVYYVFRGIQNAVSGATAGDTVNVGAGTYAGNVSINKGITLAGAGMDETHLTGGIDLSNTAFSNLTFKDFTVSGASDNAVVKNGKVTNFTMDGVRIDGEEVAERNGFASGKFDGNVSITNSEFLNIRGGGSKGWSAFDNSTGGSATALTNVVFSNNILDNTVGHIAFRGNSSTQVEISDNIVRNVGDTTNLSGGIFKVFGADIVDFTNNVITGIAAIPGKSQNGINDGAALIVRDVATLNVTGNTFTNNQEAILVDNGKNLPVTTNFSGNTFTNNAYDINFGNGVGPADVHFGAGNTFTSGAQSQQFLILGSSGDVDMTNVQFDGKLGSAMTNAELFGLEDHITHGLDNAATGLVTVKAGNLYVTANSGSIQRGVNKATNGDTINVAAGTYGAFGTSFGGASGVKIQTNDGAIIDGSTRPSNNRIVDLRADGTTFSGFTINNGGGGGVGVSISGQNVTVSNNNISDTLTGVQTTTENAVGNATISGNTINTAYGISLQNTGNTVSNNNVTASTEGVGLLKSSNTFTGNTFDIVNVSGHALQYYGSASANDLNASDNTVSISGGSLQGAVDLAGTDGDLNLAAGSYGLFSTLNIKNDGLTLTGAGEAQSSISTIATGYGIDVTGDDVTLSGFTLNGPASGLYGIKVQPDTGVASDRLLNFAIDHVTIDGAKKTGLDLNGVVGATIDHVTVTNTSNGNGIALTDSANVTITNSTTSGNAWGGLALYQSNGWYDQQTNNISVNTTNSFGEANPVYMEDQSASTDFGSVNIAGYTLAGHNVNPADKYTWLNNSVTGLADWMQAKAELATGYITGWTGTGSNNTFSVGHATDGTAMSISSAASAASTGATINVLSGTYGAFGTSFGGASDVMIQTADGAIIDGTGLTGRIIDLRADGTTLTGFTINGSGTGVGVSVSGQNVKVIDNTINGTLTGVQTTTQYPAGNATISGNTINTAHGISLQNTGNTVSNNNVTASAEGVGLLEGDNTFTGNTFDIGAGGNAMALYGSASANDLNASGNTVTIAGGGLQGAVDLTGAGGSLNVNGGTYAEDVVVNGASRNISFVGATLDKFTTNVATAIGGTVSAVNGFFLNAATTLLSNTVLNGSVAATSIDGSTAGGQTLAVNGGNNALGSLGATTRLGATSISGTTTLNGSTYAANALSFAGPVTLTQSQTTFNTTTSPNAAGNITFTGSIFGTTDGAQSVAFIAGPGTGAAGANGDISLQNAGTDALWLGSMDATGDDFSAATVYVGGSYNSMLTGNQTFTSTTLHTRGSVTSNVGGNATGPIVSNGDVNIVTGGGFNGNVTAPTGTIQGQTITGTFTGDTFTFVASQNIDVDVNANSINVSAPAGTVDGTFSTISTSGGSLVVNGQTRTGDNGANPNQIVVEGYTLPAGAVVTPSGEIILPSGMVIGLISPQAGLGAEGGKPKVIIVHSVQRLGELLAQGYVAIIVDLSKNSDETEEIALAN